MSGISKRNLGPARASTIRREIRTIYQKILWLSPNKFVFEFISGTFYGVKRNELFVSERGQPLKYFMQNYGPPDRLCWFCEHTISVHLLHYRGKQTCLLGKGLGDVDFCEAFKRGHAFGECLEKDIGSRKKMAEAIFAKIRFQSCGHCRFWNRKGVYRWTNKEGCETVFENQKAAFCELKRKPGFQGDCNALKQSQDRFELKSLEKQKLELAEYIEKLKSEERKE